MRVTTLIGLVVVVAGVVAVTTAFTSRSQGSGGKVGAFAGSLNETGTKVLYKAGPVPIIGHCTIPGSAALTSVTMSTSENGASFNSENGDAPDQSWNVADGEKKLQLDVNSAGGALPELEYRDDSYFSAISADGKTTLQGFVWTAAVHGVGHDCRWGGIVASFKG